MAHTRLFDRMLRSLRLAAYCEDEGISTEEGLQRRAAAEGTPSRRHFLTGVGALAATGALGALASGCASEDDEGGVGRSGQALYNGPPLDIGIVGAGLAGLVCADELRLNGVVAALYEANTRTGGRQWSRKGLSPGQTIELGGELIDTSQKNMINYARTFKLALEDYNKSPGDTFYFIDGKRIPEAGIVESFRTFVSAIQDDLRKLSAAPSADDHTAFDVLIDNMTVAQYLQSRGADPLLTAVVAAAYVGEYGLEITEQSALSFILYVRANRRSTFQPFGASDQRFHIVDGNDGVAKGLTARVARQVQLGMALTAARKLPSGKIELTFSNGQTRTHDIVVFAIPFTVLRNVTLDASLGLPAWKLKAIRELGYGRNAKNMVAFTARPWVAMGNNGMAYATLPNLQNSWETSWTTATGSSAVITNFTGGALAASQGAPGTSAEPQINRPQTEAFLSDFDAVYPGASASAKRDALGNPVAIMMCWPKNPWALGGYTCYRPGQFTSIAGNEGKPVGNVHFAGEHCDSFYNQQGFMEGALCSGIRTAATIMSNAQRG